MTLRVDHTDEIFWEGLAFTLYSEAPLTQEQRDVLQRFLECWYEVGVMGGFGPSSHGKGVMHNMSEVVFGDDSSVQWYVDMGSVSEAALSGLTHALEVFSAELAAPLERLVLGYHDAFVVDEK